MEENAEKKLNFDSMTLAEKLGNFEGVLVSKHDLNVESRIDKICNSTSMKNVIVVPSLNASASEFYYGIFSPKEVVKILKAEKYIQKVYNKNLFVYGGYSVEDVARVSNYVTFLAERINTMTVETYRGKRLLTPFEKCLLVHEIVSSQHYENDTNPVASKSIYGGLLSGHMDCSGCAKFMCELLKLCAIPAVTESIIVQEENGFNFENAFHCACKVLIFDPIYQIKGVYICDPTFDMAENDQLSGIDYAVVEVNEYFKRTYAEVDFVEDKLDLLETYRNITKSRVTSRLGNINLDKLLQNPTKISREKFVKAIRNIYFARGTSQDRISILIKEKLNNSSRKFYEERTFEEGLREK